MSTQGFLRKRPFVHFLAADAWHVAKSLKNIGLVLGEIEGRIAKKAQSYASHVDGALCLELKEWGEFKR